MKKMIILFLGNLLLTGFLSSPCACFASESAAENSIPPADGLVAELNKLQEERNEITSVKDTSAIRNAAMRDRRMREIVLMLGDIGNKDTMSILEKYAEGSGRLSDISGNAQVALAKLGDKKNFEMMKDELYSENPLVVSDAFAKLGLVGNKEAVRILAGYLDDFNSPQNPDANTFEGGRDVLEFFPKAILAAQGLARAITSAPTPTRLDLYNNSDVKKWQEWWVAHSNEYADVESASETSAP